jgi:hypothetical protein
MDFASLLHIVENEPVFETGLLLSGNVDPFDVRKQLSRWTTSGKILQVRRGLYCLAQPYQKSVPHPFLIANRLVDWIGRQPLTTFTHSWNDPMKSTC